MNHISSQSFDRSNYDVVMMNVEKLLNKNYGNYLRPFLTDVDSSTTNIRIVLEDGRLDPNQAMESVEYLNVDHKSIGGKDQVINKFTELI